MTAQAWVLLFLVVCMFYVLVFRSGYNAWEKSPEKPKTFEDHYKLEYQMVFGEGSASRAHAVLSSAKALLGYSYDALRELGGDNPSPHYKSAERWAVFVQTKEKIKECHRHYDYVRGLAYLYGHGQIADEVHRRK